MIIDMATYRVGEYASLVMDMGYVIQKKVWWGWKTVYHYDEFSKDAIKKKAREIEKKGHLMNIYER